MFHVGQRVVALTTNLERGRQKDKIYTITWEYTCICGQQIVAWGAKHGWLPTETKHACHVCNRDIQYTEYFTNRAEEFAPIQEYGDSMSIAISLVQDMERVDKPQLPIKEPKKENV